MTILEEKINKLSDEQKKEAVGGVPPERVTPLLVPVMRNGRTLQPQPSLQDSRTFFLREFGKVPEQYKVLEVPTRYPVALTPVLERFQQNAVARLRAKYGVLTG